MISTHMKTVERQKGGTGGKVKTKDCCAGSQQTIKAGTRVLGKFGTCQDLTTRTTKTTPVPVCFFH